jgi:hypothetical protein
MRIAGTNQPGTSSAQTLPIRGAFAALLILAAFGLGSTSAQGSSTGQNSAAKPAATSQKSPARAPKRMAAAKTSPAAPAEEAAPPLPDWPANDHPAPAKVVWNSQGLRIEAANSSLQQILTEVSTITGAKISGLGPDQRIFGTFGPGPARDVITNLLDGSGYNVLMIGDQGQGTPRQIVLSKQPTGPAPPSMNNNSSHGSDDSSADAEEATPPPEPQQPPNTPPGYGPGAQPRTPQQILREMQQRQQQIEQMQQQQQQQQREQQQRANPQ